jgi:anion-transporting  ArsA/GET3 family ATPase
MTVFCGKGGTGKTALSLALGLCHALRGRTTVVVTSHPLKDLAASVSLSGLREAHRDAAERLFIIHVDATEVLNNIVRRKIPSGFLLNTILRSSVYQSLIEVAPGLKEIALLHRLHRLAEDRIEQGRKFDSLVWDAPATGHFLQTLRVSRNFETYLSGPFALMGAEAARFTADSGNFSVVPVTTLEEMAVQETIELCRELESSLHIPARTVICNMTSPLAGSNAAPSEVFSLMQGDNAADVEFLARRSEIERSHLLELRETLRAKPLLVRRHASEATDFSLLRHIAGQIEELAEAAP